MMRRGTKTDVRLLVGCLLNMGLWLVVRELGTWRSLDREYHLYLLGGSVAGVALVVVLPLFWKQPSWMVPIIFGLTCFPVVVLLQVCLLLLK